MLNWPTNLFGGGGVSTPSAIPVEESGQYKFTKSRASPEISSVRSGLGKWPEKQERGRIYLSSPVFSTREHQLLPHFFFFIQSHTRKHAHGLKGDYKQLLNSSSHLFWINVATDICIRPWPRYEYFLLRLSLPVHWSLAAIGPKSALVRCRNCSNCMARLTAVKVWNMELQTSSSQFNPILSNLGSWLSESSSSLNQH